MSSDLIHPDLQGVARFLPRTGFGKYSLRVARVLQPLGERFAGDKSALVVTINEHVSIRLHLPPNGDGDERRPALLWIHGGGYVMGNAAQDDRFCARVASQLNAVVANVDYRLAPEHPFPAPLDDCHAALRWLANRPDVDPHRIAVGGASAGGGLAAGLVLQAHDEGVIAPVFQLLVYPMIDDRTVLRDLPPKPYRLWSPTSNRFGWQAYLNAEPGTTGISDHAAAARREDLTGLPPAWIGVGSVDLFHDEDVDYAERLAAAGVPTELDVVPGAFHGFDAVAAKANVAKDFTAAQIAALGKAFAG